MKQRALGAGSSTLGFAALLLSLLFVHPMAAPADQTAAGTVITNTSGASYTDLNSFTYSATSNEVSITVQNAPSMTITQGTNQTVAPGQTVTDSFIITNTGNAAGTVTFSAGSGVTGGGDSASATVTYDCTTCSGGPTNLAGLNSELQSLPVAAPTSGTPSPSITVEVMYTLSADAASSNTSSNTAGTDDVQTNLTGTITYPAVTGASAATSTSVSAASFEDDWVKTDAFLNVGLSSTTSGGTITYTANVANGSTTWPAQTLISVKKLLGLSQIGSAGLFISVKVPQYPANTPLTITGTPTVTTSAANGFPTTATAVIYSTANSTGASGWTAGATPVANATYIGVYIKSGYCNSGGGPINIHNLPSGICANANAANSSPGNVTTANAAVSLSFAVTASTASGSANANSTTTIANTLIGNNADTELVVGPGLITVADSGSITDITATGEGINNTTSLEAPSGASTVASTQSSASYSLMNGPFGYPSATGTYDGSTNNTTHDFTIVSFASPNGYQTTNTTASDTPTTASTTASSVSNIKVENTVANLGNATDAVTLTATAPSGWTVELESDNAGVPGSALGAASSLATYAATVSIASGASLNYWAVYTAPSGVSYLSHAIGTLVATSGNDATKTDTTANIIYAGFLAVTTTATTTPNCPAGTSPPTGSVCPGGTITYTIDYRNIVNHADVSSVPTISFAHVMTTPGTLVITADGTGTAVSGNNWATTTNGPNAEPVDTTSGTTYTYWSGSNGSTPAASFQTGLTKFIATIGGSTFQLAPFGFSGTNYNGTITYSVTAH